MSNEVTKKALVQEIKNTYDDFNASAVKCDGEYGSKAAGVRSRKLARHLCALLRTWNKVSVPKALDLEDDSNE